MDAAVKSGVWTPDSWQGLPALQQPVYRDPGRLARVLGELSRLPPIVVSWEVDQLKAELAAAQRGERFLLQGGDCAEGFADCDSDTIARKLKILLQMSVVLLHGLKKPVIRVGRIAGQYAKPRSADTETRDGVTLPSYRGDLVNRAAFTPADREPDPELLLRGYERAALTLNFVRALVDGGFADLHHPEYWDLGFLQHAKLARRLPPDHRLDLGLARLLRRHLRLARPRGRAGALLREPRGTAPALRAGADALPQAPAALVQPLDAHAVDRDAHRVAGRRARRVLPRHRQPDRASRWATGMDAAKLRRARPHPEPGRRARPADADPPLRRAPHRDRRCPP